MIKLRTPMAPGTQIDSHGLTLAFLCACLGLGACGGDGESDPDGASTEPTVATPSTTTESSASDRALRRRFDRLLFELLTEGEGQSAA